MYIAFLITPKKVIQFAYEANGKPEGIPVSAVKCATQNLHATIR